MRFEKLSENKIRIFLTSNDLKEKDIDFHSFMSNSSVAHGLFLDILEEAKNKIGFNTCNYNVKIDALAMIDGDFVVNVSRVLPEQEKNTLPPPIKKKLKVRKKNIEKNSDYCIYKFDNFDDYYHFIEFLYLHNLSDAVQIAKNIVVYLYMNQYYLILNNINNNYKHTHAFSSSITEFGTFVNSSQLFVSKLHEYGKLVIKNNALRNSLKYFKKKDTV